MTQLLEWKDEYKTGIESIDRQHHTIFNSINELHAAIQELRGADVVGTIIAQLVEYADTHFSFEERYFKEFEYEEAAVHIAEHQAYRDRVADFVRNRTREGNTLSFEILDFLEDWWLQHISTTDHRYIQCFKDHGLT